MGTQSARRVGWLANIGCALGVLSLGFVAYAVITPFIFRLDRYELEGPLVAGVTVLFRALVGWLLGLVGSVVSFIALRRKMKEGGENTSKGIAIIGLVLGGLGVSLVCILLTLVFVFNSPNPPPVMITPSPLIP